MKQIEKIALFDLDGTLCDYDAKIEEGYNLIKSPEEHPYQTFKHKQEPEYIHERIKLIRNQTNWWEKLPRLKLGFDVLGIANELNFNINILTKGPASSYNAWTEKAKWVKKNIKNDYPNAKLTITEDKGLVYGTVLVDDWIEYAERWLTWRPRGVVIMPAHPWNKEYSHPNVTRYDGTNIEQVKDKLIWAKNRLHNI
jgi:FMN phosphatase YigB (HAD superfamily)